MTASLQLVCTLVLSIFYLVSAQSFATSDGIAFATGTTTNSISYVFAGSSITSAGVPPTIAAASEARTTGPLSQSMVSVVIALVVLSILCLTSIAVIIFYLRQTRRKAIQQLQDKGFVDESGVPPTPPAKSPGMTQRCIEKEQSGYFDILKPLKAEEIRSKCLSTEPEMEFVVPDSNENISHGSLMQAQAREQTLQTLAGRQHYDEANATVESQSPEDANVCHTIDETNVLTASQMTSGSCTEHNDNTEDEGAFRQGPVTPVISISPCRSPSPYRARSILNDLYTRPPSRF